MARYLIALWAGGACACAAILAEHRRAIIRFAGPWPWGYRIAAVLETVAYLIEPPGFRTLAPRWTLLAAAAVLLVVSLPPVRRALGLRDTH